MKLQRSRCWVSICMVKIPHNGIFSLQKHESQSRLFHLKLQSLSPFPLPLFLFCKPRGEKKNATFKGLGSILCFCRWQRLVSSTMKASVLLVFSSVLPLISAQVPHWGPCPEPDVQPAFSLKQVQVLVECVGSQSNIATPTYVGNKWKAKTSYLHQIRAKSVIKQQECNCCTKCRQRQYYLV